MRDRHGFTARTLKKHLVTYMEEHKLGPSTLAVLALKSTVHAYIVTGALQKLNPPHLRPNSVVNLSTAQRV